ncbi:uncharacterized protein E0L32_002974 [Thyridium curvatum]|uniref:Uncharacterized protein n=1 Tax=Thyridium curvatum TaxID=1093900 RepID=A0A507BEH4_9PEZI|nr:uncharacterized protein E0L32_002974 [Thyridium curvatum]TPX17873.1 hypothetical protein E0L32_002974 [Thyridium curvatum]
MSHYDRITQEFTWDNSPLLVAAGAAFLIGYLQYYYAIKLMLTDGKGPMPVWMHIFYLAHDSSFSYTLGRDSSRFGGHFFLLGSSRAYALWSALEIWCLYYGLRYHRMETFSSALGDRAACLGNSLRYTIFMLAAMYCAVLMVASMLGEGCMLHWGLLTNTIMIVGPTHEYMRRGSRDGLAVGFCVVNIACVIFTFAPFSMFAQTFPETFATKPFYICGSVLLLYSFWLLAIVVGYPPKDKERSKSN